MKTFITYRWHVLLFFFSLPLSAQISAQGQGGRDVLWLAAGIEQQLGRRWVNKNAVAYSRHSSLESWNIAQQSGVFTVREEIVYKLSKKFKLSQGVFYAERNYYDTEHPQYVNELRLYPKVHHEFSTGKIRWSHYVRTDLRFFSSPGFKAYAKPLEIRNRYRIKAALPLDEENRNAFVAMTEFFFATDEKKNKDGSRYFTVYHFTENRTSLYFRHRLQKINACLDAGVMVQTWRPSHTEPFRQTYILQIDFILINPFRR